MNARNKKTGSAIVGMLETYMATTGIDEYTFARNLDGTLGFEYDDQGAEINWDCGEPALGQDGKAQYVDENGDIVSEKDVELFDDENA